MKKVIPICLILLVMVVAFPCKIYSQTADSKTKAKMELVKTIKDTHEKIFIDRFFVPKGAKQEFDLRMKINRDFIKTLQGFINDSAYERIDEHGDFIIVTVAIWEDEESIKNAKQAVQAEYKREGFDMQGMLKRLSITIDRGVYKHLGI